MGSDKYSHTTHFGLQPAAAFQVRFRVASGDHVALGETPLRHFSEFPLQSASEFEFLRLTLDITLICY
jgi:hypothetical protein